MASRVGTAAIGIASASAEPLDGAHRDAQAGEGAGTDGDGQSREVAHRPARVGEHPVDGRHQALGVRDADVEQVLGHEVLPVEQRHPAGERRGFDGQQAHTAGV